MTVSSELLTQEPFYFTSHDRVIGVDRNVNVLQRELARLDAENITASQHHLVEYHIVRSLEHSKEKKLVEKLNGVGIVGEAQIIISGYLEKKSGAAPRVSMSSRKERTEKELH